MPVRSIPLIACAVVLLTQKLAHHYGLGEHLVDIDQDRLQTLFKSFYVHIGGYYTCAGLVKLSLLCQYLRLFKQGIVRKVCIVLLVLISLWSFLWFFQGWAPCFPVSGFWNRTQQPPPKCWGTDPDKPESAVVLFVAFAASNMTLDTIIFLIPIHLLLKPNTAGKQVLALMGLFSLGSMYVRLLHATEDFTNATIAAFFSCLSYVYGQLFGTTRTTQGPSTSPGGTLLP